MAEWLKAAVLKTVERLRVPGVRIPPPPPQFQKTRQATQGLDNLIRGMANCIEESLW